jgi:hypothetical protein
MTFGDMARALGLEVEGHVLYTTTGTRQAEHLPSARAPHRAAAWGVDYYLGRTLGGALVIGGDQDARVLVLAGDVEVSLDEVNRQVFAGTVQVA